MAEIAGHLAFYPDKVKIEEVPGNLRMPSLNGGTGRNS